MSCGSIENLCLVTVIEISELWDTVAVHYETRLVKYIISPPKSEHFQIKKTSIIFIFLLKTYTVGTR